MKSRCFLALALFAFPLLGGVEPVAAMHSRLWGERGEAWQVDGPLPDFSRAGFREGDAALPVLPQSADVRDFGAKGDGVTDDTRAIQAAVEATSAGAVYLPPGRYLISDFIRIRRPGVVLRGAGPERSVLWFPRGLDALHPRERKTASGTVATGYSFEGGFVTIEGDYRERLLARPLEPVERGERELRVDDVASLVPGRLLSVVAREDEARLLARHLYDGDPGDLSKSKSFDARQLVRVEAVNGDRVRLDRPLRFALRPEWRPELREFEPSVTGSGVESLGFAFPGEIYAGHFKERGQNAIELRGVYACWVRDVSIHNADLGVNVEARGCTLTGLRLSADATREIQQGGGRGYTGHHGIQIKHGEDNLIADFVIETTFFHDLSVEDAAGNVFTRGRGRDLCLDHHKDTPYLNLFTCLDLGRGTRPWMSGGGNSLGKNAAGRNVYWGLRADRDLKTPAKWWGPASLVFVGLRMEGLAGLRSEAPWVEAIPPEALSPADLHAAQLALRRQRASQAPPVRAAF